MRKILCRSVSMLLALLALANAAYAVDLEGVFMQGGMVKGSGEPGIKLLLDGEEVYVSPGGRFVFGFGRDAPPNATLTIFHPDGREEVRKLAVTSQDYQIERVDGLPPQTVIIPEEERLRREEEMAKVAAARAGFSERFDWDAGFMLPAEGRISGVYGSQRILNGEPRFPHYGLDIAGPAGTSVHAPAGGVVVLAEEDFLLEGSIIIIDHGFGISSTLMHLSSVEVEEGQRVERGELVGRRGASGRASGPHVDWRVNWRDVRLDPALLVGDLSLTTEQEE